MKNCKQGISTITVVLLSLIMVLSCAFLSFAADGNVTASKAKELTLGEKTSITFDSSFKDKYYKIKITEKGTYKIYVYSDRDDSSKDFGVGLYSSAKNASNMSNQINSDSRMINYDTPDTDYSYYKLKTGTYYLRVQGWNTKYKKTGLKIVKAINTYEWLGDGVSGKMYRYQTMGVYMYDINSKKAKVTKVESSDPEIVKVDKDSSEYSGYYVTARKSGQSTITIRYKASDGKIYKRVKTITVRKYPLAIKSLKVNGKSVSITNNRFRYYTTTTGTTAKAKIDLQNGWEIQNVYIGRNDWDSGKHIEIKNAKSKILNGTAIDFPKSYDRVYFELELRKGENLFSYGIYVERP